MVVESFDDVLDLCAGAGHSKSTSLKHAVAEANRSVQTDMSTEHPVLAQMLVGVGFGDGMPLANISHSKCKS
jgi:hypothetical protein